MIGSLPHWPAMMDLELACAYTQLGETQFKALSARYNVAPRDLGGIRGVRWRRSDLDRLIDSLPARGEPSDQDAAVDQAQAALQRVRKRAARR
ncbi:hypothetical protein [Caulobacter segnis]|uniref:Uncharacterized protein n=1 Tax=Caulobacter segnis TaxID=88688 RepID=A0A2W5VPG7_9CAUL|nr:hypothetical protein [Caulobacter segnis]PZR37215.1 MAG: hypothetical protein DI526_01475 [Caulobacter segnis]